MHWRGDSRRDRLRGARRGRRVLAVVTAVLAASGLLAAPASAKPLDPPPRQKPTPAAGPQHGTATPASPAAPPKSCSIYGSASGFGVLCSTASGGKTLAQLLGGFIKVNEPFCWHGSVREAERRTRGLPDGFVPDSIVGGAGQWWLHTCLTFIDEISRKTARLEYGYHFIKTGETASELTSEQRPLIELITGRGQIPFLQVQTRPVSSPRVRQDVAFSLLCDRSKVECTNTASGRRIATPELDVGGVTMFAELVHLAVLPEGAGAPSKETECVGAGLPLTAEELDAASADDRRICRYRYERSSDDAGGGSNGDRYLAQVSAFWQIYVRDRDGLRTFGDPYEKKTVQQLRVTEVQTLVVS